MSDDTVVRPAVWRASPDLDDVTPRDATASGRILLLVRGHGNREQLAQHLRRYHEVVEPDHDDLPDRFDVAVVDGPGYRRWGDSLGQAKAAEEPVFLPVMIVLPRREIGTRAARSDVIDDFVVAPIQRDELLERISILLRARRLAVEQRERLTHVALHDTQTGLPNRDLFLERLHTAIHEASLLERVLYVIVVRIPLGGIMKSMGHAGLERAARACSVRLRHLMGDDNFSLARLTTEEWSVFARAEQSMDEVMPYCQRIASLSAEPIQVGDERVRLSAYIGISSYPQDAGDGRSLLDCACGALTHAQTPGEPAFYSRDVQQHALTYIRTESKLHEAIEREQFELHFQPQVSLESGRIIGAEALVRWRLPSGEMVSPGAFLPVAEASGLVTRIDRWVLSEACAALKRWSEAGHSDYFLAVNVTPADVLESDFVGRIERIIEAYELMPHSLELELTETMLCAATDELLGRLDRLRAFGVGIAVDDFGTGYSSLSYLQSLPLTLLKIDKAFVDGVPGDPSSEGITEAIVGLARRFGLEVVAEGIESDQQLKYLSALDISVGQGFRLGRPMPEREFLSLVEGQTTT